MVMTDLDPRDLAAEERSELMAQADKEEGEPQGIKPGLHFDLPNDDYHALTDWFSSTQLKRALPEDYKEGGSQEALDFGSLFHAVSLEPDNVAHYLPADPFEIGLKADGSRADNPLNTRRWKDFVTEAEQDGKSIVPQDWWDRAQWMRDAIATHPEARELVFSDDGESEVSAFATDANGLRHKARFDRLIPATGVDLKSTNAQPGEYNLTKTVIAYGYELSAAHYLAVADLLDLKLEKFTLVFVGKTEPYRVTVCDLDDIFLRRGRELREKAIERLLQRADSYEGATGRLLLTCPLWALPNIEMEMS